MKANSYIKEMEEILKHRGHKEREHHHSHHHLHLFHLSGHHKEHQQQTGTVETYREVSSALDEPSNTAQSSGSSLKLTVGRIV